MNKIVGRAGCDYVREIYRFITEEREGGSEREGEGEGGSEREGGGEGGRRIEGETNISQQDPSLLLKSLTIPWCFFILQYILA